MPERLIEIEGLEEACRSLTEAPRAVRARALLRGLAAGGAIFEEAIRVRVPAKHGDLKADLGTTVELRTDLEGGTAKSGFGKQGYKAGWIEYGHRMIGHKPEKKDLGRVEAHPFMRPAAAVAEEAAVEACVDAMLEEFTAAGVVDAA